MQAHEGECWLRCDQCCIVWTAHDEVAAKAQLAKPLPITGRALPSLVTEAIVGSVREDSLHAVPFRPTATHEDLEELALMHGNAMYEA